MIVSNYGERGSLLAFGFIWQQSRKDNDLKGEKRMGDVNIYLFVLFLIGRYCIIELLNNTKGLKTPSSQNCNYSFHLLDLDTKCF
jgi:hypothetical protein